mmetsp:Transcript_43265/g.111749  ORF Transcript_43265/g.111749 Transcript_43265/m.111749 type:complete len:263 (+) Transcript_43265:375-1163(+)
MDDASEAHRLAGFAARAKTLAWPKGSNSSSGSTHVPSLGEIRRPRIGPSRAPRAGERAAGHAHPPVRGSMEADEAAPVAEARLLLAAPAAAHGHDGGGRRRSAQHLRPGAAFGCDCVDREAGEAMPRRVQEAVANLRKARWQKARQQEAERRTHKRRHSLPVEDVLAAKEEAQAGAEAHISLAGVLRAHVQRTSCRMHLQAMVDHRGDGAENNQRALSRAVICVEVGCQRREEEIRDHAETAKGRIRVAWRREPIEPFGQHC